MQRKKIRCICDALLYNLLVEALNIMRETRFLEFKSDISNSFLKTVSAYSNIGTGTIRFGYDDNGVASGLKGDLRQICLDLENKINDSIHPKPNYRFECNFSNNTIDLFVYEGMFKPYLYKAKAYKRNDSSTIEMDSLELQRAILEGRNLSFEQLDVEGDLSFESFAKKMYSILKIDVNHDVLKTLGLINDDGKFNKAALIVSDNNNLAGVDIVKFGDTISQIKDRITISHASIFDMFDAAYDMYKKYYVYEEIDGLNRKVVNLIPENAFREALANALVHRAWDDVPNVRISMYEDRIEITSPGGLLHSISKEEYLDGQVSKPRNPIIANIFFRLRYIEMFGTGILRIKQIYQNATFKPDFKVFENSISVVLPSFSIKPLMTLDEKKVVDYLAKGIQASSNDLTNITGFSKDKVLRLLKSLSNKGYVKISGVGKSTKYSV